MTGPSHVSDIRANPNEQIAHAVKVIGRSPVRYAIFKELHRGRKRIKTATEIAKAIGFTRKRVLDEGKKLVDKQVIGQTTRDGDVAYEREGHYYRDRDAILKYVKNPKKLSKLPTGQDEDHHPRRPGFF